MAAAHGFDEVRSGDPLFTFDAGLVVQSWNGPAEALTGVAAAEAVGRRCWELLGGRDESGELVCRPGCPHSRLAFEGSPVPSHGITIQTRQGRQRVTLSTIAIRRGEQPLLAHALLPGVRAEEGDTAPPPSPEEPAPALTPRQNEILGRLAEGQPAKVISRELGIAEPTVRNHIRAVLVELDCHSQLAAIAKSRRLGLL